MVKKIVWTKTADTTFDKITQYFIDNGFMQAAELFAQAVYDKIDLLTEQPFIGRLSTKAKTVRIIKIGKNIQMLYRVDGKKLIIVDFFDTRQNPDKSKY